MCVCVVCVHACVRASIWSGANFRETGRLVPSPRCPSPLGSPRHQLCLSGSWLALSVTPGNNHCLTSSMAVTGFIETDWGTPRAASDHQHMVCRCVYSNTHAHIFSQAHTNTVFFKVLVKLKRLCLTYWLWGTVIHTYKLYNCYNLISPP